MDDLPEHVVDPRLKKWATDQQKQRIDLINQLGGYRSAGRQLNIQHTTLIRMVERVEKRARLAGFDPAHDMTHPTADPFVVKGVSTYYDSEGKVRGQWVKTQLDRGLSEAAIRDFVEHLIQEARGLAPLTPPPESCADELLALYGFGDPHFGMYAWKEETGDDFDLATAQRLTQAAIDRMVASAPPAKTALLLNAGDFFHGDNSKNQTPGSGHALDIDTRHAKVVQVGARAMVYAVRRMLEKHERVLAWMMPGNHDPETSFALALCLALYFENEPRVEIDLTPGLYKYMRFGKVLIGAHHGHGAKMSELPLLMAADRPEDWGLSRFRYWYCGHIHHKTVDKEHPGVVVETLRTLAPRDAWHAGKGYRAGRDAQLIIHHAEYGEIERHRCDVAMLS